MTDTTREALAADIKAAIAELAQGRKFPDLIAAIDRLATPEQAPAVRAGALADELRQWAAWCADDSRSPSVTMPQRPHRVVMLEAAAALATTPAVQAEQPAEPVCSPQLTECPRCKNDVLGKCPMYAAPRGQAEDAQRLDSHGRYWVENRGRILDAIRDAGFQLVSNVNGFRLERFARIDAARADARKDGAA